MIVHGLSLGLFAIASLLLAVYGVHLYVLLWLFRRRVRQTRATQRTVIEQFRQQSPPSEWPDVTSQIPIYNEAEVAERVIRAVCAMNYPRDKHEVQVLDDSTDVTAGIVDNVVKTLQEQGVRVRTLRRADRANYKAGALANGLSEAQGRYVAIFDADFVPPGDFLSKAVPLLESAPDMACLQGRWTHLNQEESWLTRAQALGIDGHFAIEQGARAWNGLMMNFNGTAGVWRREALEDPAVGGWQADTLTEDLDLSYRAQLAGWRIDYCLDMPCPAELPGDIKSLKTQQARWATGSIQTAVKLLPRIWRSSAGLWRKIEATIHLTHYSVAVWMLALAVIARPMLLAWGEIDGFDIGLGLLLTFILASAIAPSLVYTYARYQIGGRWGGLKIVPLMIVLGAGLCLSNAIAVIRGLAVRGGEFVRTPKSGSFGRRSKPGCYKPVQDRLWIVEMALGTYSAATWWTYAQTQRWLYAAFLLFYAAGFLVVGWLSSPLANAAPSARPVSPDQTAGDIHIEIASR